MPIVDRVSSSDQPSPCSSQSSEEQIANKREEQLKTHIIAGEASIVNLKKLCYSSKKVMVNIVIAFQESFDKEPPSNVSQPRNNSDFLNRATLTIERFCIMAKKLEPFQTLEKDDRVTLVKGATVEVLILRSIKLFDSRANQWKNTFGSVQQNVSAHVLTLGNDQSKEFFREYVKFASRFQATIKEDNNVLMLLIVMALFSIDRDGHHEQDIKNTEFIANTQEMYASVLHEYIQCTYSEDKDMFAKVLQLLTDIRNLDHSHMPMIKQIPVMDLAQVLWEVFDLTPKSENAMREEQTVSRPLS